MRRLLITMFIVLLSNAGYCAPVFEILPLGVYGGLKDGNLSAYLIKAYDDQKKLITIERNLALKESIPKDPDAEMQKEKGGQLKF
jgi:hypothetical protein